MLYLQNPNHSFKTVWETSHIPENELSRIKTKLRNTCEKYWNVKVPCKYKDIVSKLSKREGLVILKQDKGRGVVLMDRHKYSDKCLRLLLTKQFTVLNNDPTKTLESKVQRTLRKLKSKFTEQEYKKLYPTRSCPWKFYGTAMWYSMLLKKFYSKYLNSIINEQMVLIIVTIISMATIYLPWIMNQWHLRSNRYLSYPIKLERETTFWSSLRKEWEKFYSIM